MTNRKLFAQYLLKWYNIHKRDLPWRNTQDAYVIWLSEVILQQTRVNQGLPYFNKFLETYPTVQHLAAAEEQEVLRLWQGLGYYSRAKNLHACAKTIVSNWEGKFPTGYKNLLQLEGVGKYTAAAIASFAFNKKVAVVDGNVYRVISRVFGLSDDITSATGQAAFQQFADTLLPDTDSAEHNQAIMEFGALHCTPRQPLCDGCCFESFCFAKNNNVQHTLPVKSKKVKVIDRYFDYIVIRHKHLLLLRKRDKKDIWNGLYDFFLIESSKTKELETIIDRLQGLLPSSGTTITAISPVFKHILTHQRIFARFFLIDIGDEHALNRISQLSETQPYSLNAVKNLPKPILINNYLSENIF